AKLDGITATNLSGQKVEITSAGVTSYDGAGILASSATGIVKVTNNGAVTSQLEGIKASSLGNSAVSVEQNGALTSYSKSGISAWSATGAVNVTGEGDITAELNGIVTGNEGYGKITIERSGNITAYKGTGIIASSTDGEIAVTSEGVLTADVDGIVATNEGNAKISVTQVGNLTAYKGTGIVVSSANGELSVSNTGTLTAELDGIDATNIGSGKVTVYQDGSLTSNTGTGIVASSTTGAVTVIGNGAILADLDGIVAKNEGLTAVQVTQTGNVTANKGSGIIATSALGAITITSTGDILADGYGINAVNSSDDGAITIEHTGDITAANYDGIYAETANADIDVTVDGDISAHQDAIHLVSYGDQSVTVDGGRVTGGAGFAAVHFDGGYENSLVNAGTIDSADGINGLAILANDNNTSIVNNGTITGSVVLSDWSNSFLNGEDGVFNMGDTVHLGAGNTLTNDGSVSVGQVGQVATTALTGSFVNGSTGTLLLDIDLAGSTADRLDVSGTASLSGTLGLHFTSLGQFDQTFTVLTADTVTTSALLVSNPLVQYAIDNVNEDHLDLTVAGYEYLVDGLNENGRAFGSYLNQVIGNVGALDPIALSLLNLTSIEAVNEAYNQLTPADHLNEQLMATYNSLGFANSLMSCKVRDGAYVFNAEGECAWGRIGYRTFDRDSTFDTSGFTRDTWELAGGAQYAVKDNYRLGFAFAASTSKSNGADGSTSDGKQVEGGVVLKYVPGPLTLAASASGSYGWYDSERFVAFGDFYNDLTSKPEAGSLNGRLRAAYDFGNDKVYVRPQIEGNATYLYQSAFTETGGVAAMSVDSVSRTVFSAAPSIEVGGQVVTT
ncbi:MAG: autotransporter domain-containing protein, partial [Rhizobiales bacterium]|nr:autotransporter domain-containing protein [Hyphomicrobiales bacterium]